VTTVLCPGSFDPPTNGHLDVIERMSRVCSRVVVGVVRNPSKEPMFPSEERVALLSEILRGLPNVDVESFDGLLVDFARERGVDVIAKGLRAVTDFDYELQMAQMNHSLTGVETLFIPTNPEWSYLSSSLVKEVARLGGDVTDLIPPVVADALKERLT
jgi:pantetheine-phosphate adenylyltransferase